LIRVMSNTAPQSDISPIDVAPCPICGGASGESYPGLWKMRDGGREFRYRECTACRTLFCDPLPTEQEIHYLYTERYDFEWFRQHRLLKRIQAWHRFLRLGRLLRQLGVGSDGARIQNGSIEAAQLPLGRFDLLTMLHILEYTRHPRAALRRVAEVLKVGSLCFIAVPNRDATGLAFAGWGWGWLQKPFIHIFGFSECGLWRLTALMVERVWHPSPTDGFRTLTHPAPVTAG
jgi:Methyltransferase domain